MPPRPWQAFWDWRFRLSRGMFPAMKLDRLLEISGTEGLLPAPAVIPAQPTTWVNDPTVFNAGNVDLHSLLLGPAFKFMELHLLPSTANVLVMVLPPGGFLTTGLLIIGKRMLDLRAGKSIQMAGAHSVG